jgi:hypothetical protein
LGSTPSYLERFVTLFESLLLIRFQEEWQLAVPGFARVPPDPFPDRLAAARAWVRLCCVLALLACTAYPTRMQYTIRNVPHKLDEALRPAAREQGKSLNDVAIEALARGAGVWERTRQRDLRDVAGSWRKDPAIDNAWPRRTLLTKRCGSGAGVHNSLESQGFHEVGLRSLQRGA